MNFTPLILGTAFFVLLIGLLLFWFSSREGFENPHTAIEISWLLIPLFPVLLLFLFFQGNSISGTILGFSVGGAVGLYVFIWWFGARYSRNAIGLDSSMQQLNKEKRELQHELQHLKSQGTQSFEPKELNHSIPYIFHVKVRGGKKIALITGRIEQVSEADVWVSSENTDMQMARYYDRSISGVIRYRGAKKDASGNVFDDIIAKELKVVVDGNVPVAPTTVFVTDSGELAPPPNNVKKIFHVASVRGEAGIGYEPVKNIQFCVSEVLRVADSEECKASSIKSVLFPLLGAGTAKGNAEDIAQKLIPFALEYFETTKNSAIEYVYFLARTDFECDVCYRVLQQLEQSGRLVAERGSN